MNIQCIYLEEEGKMFCAFCGAEIPDGSAFCTKCGATVEEAKAAVGEGKDEIVEEKTNICKQCGAILEAWKCFTLAFNKLTYFDKVLKSEMWMFGK